jgi:hypothetical protein
MYAERWPRSRDVSWLSPEELVQTGFTHSRVVMMNEAHEGLKRCVRTRHIGIRVLPTAWECGARVLAVEALGPPAGPPTSDGKLEQPEMAELLQTARKVGFRVAGYDVDPSAIPLKLRTKQESSAFTNWRDGQQAANLAALLETLPAEDRMLVWCGNMHHSKVRLLQFKPMGWQFAATTGIDPFAIDQTATVAFPQRTTPPRLLDWALPELRLRGHAGFLRAEGVPMVSPGCDAWLLSLENQME